MDASGRERVEDWLAGLPGLKVLEASAGPLDGRDFSPSDPIEAAHASAVPTGLAEYIADDADGIEAPTDFKAAEPRDVVAVDAGVVNLGQLANGVIACVRAAEVAHRLDRPTSLRTYRPGIIALTSANRLGIFHGMGREMGRENFFVTVDEGRPVEEKVRLGVHDHRLFSRMNNYVERLVQRSASDRGKNAILLLDGALTLRTYDTPDVFWRQMQETCAANNITLIAVAKTTGLTIRGVDIRLLLDSSQGRPMKRRLTRAYKSDPANDKSRILGDLFVARFAPGGATYRVDVVPGPGQKTGNALDELFNSCLFRAGYPEPLIEAHAFSYMPPPTVAQLQAHAIASHSLVVHPEPNLGPVFAPFGGRYK